ncbi:hypothetical protein C5Y97_04640 [Blastopirellula marina]|uniref:Protein containing Planctomycete extracellular domain protein n=2 Tax=Blastopirellula marina TaxID=124 RepID=A0A2S8G990_9BACT|nr:hypothetical protein C5Y98_04640 [Blastopirellula marina]PTL45752.1 hypothetical protein C5Y97_04640 [Blastopirellula marina]
MLGDVTVSVVFFESNGTGTNNTENWTETHRNEVKQRIEEAMQWWEDMLAAQSSVQELNFDIDYTYADNPVPIGVEPISQAATSFDTWVGTFLDYAGADRTDEIDNDVRRFNNQQRTDHDTNWAFTIFVINAENDSDGLFAPGSLRGAFSIAGGAFMVIPSERPASTIAHETSHQFWAMDEYASSGNYTDARGYYDTQNTNAYDGNPDPSSIVTSLLGDSAALTTAYANHTSSPSSLASIGWQDSDGDGLFDVFDVPMEFSATSIYDPVTSQLRIVGEGSIGVLPNMNSWGLQNSMTINRISHVEYRVDGGDWQTGPIIDDYTADLDFTLQLPTGEHTVEVRLVDKTGLIQSDVLTASTSHIDSTDVHGFTGYVTYDRNGNGSYDAGEEGLAGWHVIITDAQGNPVVSQTLIEPDDFSQGYVFYNPINGVTLSAIGGGIDPGLSDVSSRNSTLSSTGGRAFYNYSGNSWSNAWSDQRQLRMDFATPVSRVSIDATAELDGDIGVLELYDASGNLLGRYTTSAMAAGTSETMVVELKSVTAAYAIARGYLSDSGDPHRQPLVVGLDNLQVGRANTAVTNAWGAFTLPFDLSGNYRLEAMPDNDEQAFFTTITEVNVSLTAQAGTNHASFAVAIADTSWHNPILRADLNHDGVVDELDINLVLSELQTPIFTAGAATASRLIEATHTNGDPYIDVNGDGRFDKLDLLSVIDAKTAQELDLSSLAGEPDFVYVITPSSNSSSFGDSLTVEAEPSAASTTSDASISTNTASSSPSTEYVWLPAVRFSSVDTASTRRSISDRSEPADEDSLAAAVPTAIVKSHDAAQLDAIAQATDVAHRSVDRNDEATDEFFADLDNAAWIGRNLLY